MPRDRVTLHILPSYLGNEYARVEVDVAPNMTVSEVLEAASDDGAFGFAAFQPMMAHDEIAAAPVGDRIIYPGSSLFGLTEAGHLTTAYGIKWEDFLRGAEAGLIQGNPRELLVYVDRGSAGGGPSELIPIVTWLWENREQLEFVAWMLGGGYALAQTVRRPVLWLSAVRRRAITKSFSERGIISSGLVQFIDRNQQWDPVRLAKLLDLTEAEASALLQEVGYEPNKYGLYALSDSPEAALRRAAYFANAFGSPDAKDEHGDLYEPIVVDR